MKYRVGHTYGDDTSDLYKEYGYLHDAPPIGVMEPDQPPVKMSIPRATGDNKYTENMVPGYTGYVPRGPFEFGNTYKQESDRCIDEFTTNRDNHLANMKELNLQTSAYPRLTAISHDPVVRDHLDLYRDRHPITPILREDHKGKYEAPIPGYMGFVPRVNPTQIGLGKSYTRRAQQGLNWFGHDQEKFFGPEKELRPSQRHSVPVPLQDGYTTNRKVWSDMVTQDPYNHKLYHRGGMIPKYTGYVPQKKFVFGKTYGDATRGLEACSHGMSNYAAYVKTLPRPRPIVPC
ncbi:ciliary microtubule inner protein 2B-like isoform X2 [Babylonia areolata]